MRSLLAVLCLLTLCSIVRANEPGGGSLGPDVQITDQGPRVILDNGVIKATINKDGANVTSFQFHGQEMANTIYYSMDGGAAYMNLHGCQYSVKENTPDMADISLKSVWNNNRHQVVDIDAHYVLRRGNSGMYCYAIVSHPASYPATDFNE